MRITNDRDDPRLRATYDQFLNTQVDRPELIMARFTACMEAGLTGEEILAAESRGEATLNSHNKTLT